MTDECPHPRDGGARAHPTSVEAHLVAGSDPRAELCHSSVDGEAAGADPRFRFAPGSEPGTGEHLLQTLGVRSSFERRAGARHRGAARAPVTGTTPAADARRA